MADTRVSPNARLLCAAGVCAEKTIYAYDSHSSKKPFLVTHFLPFGILFLLDKVVNGGLDIRFNDQRERRDSCLRRKVHLSFRW